MFDALDQALMISGIASPPPPPKLLDFVRPTPRLEEEPLLKVVRKQSPQPPPTIQRPVLKRHVAEVVKKVLPEIV
jgi:hypothetical protein